MQKNTVVSRYSQDRYARFRVFAEHHTTASYKLLPVWFPHLSSVEGVTCLTMTLFMLCIDFTFITLVYLTFITGSKL